MQRVVFMMRTPSYLCNLKEMFELLQLKYKLMYHIFEHTQLKSELYSWPTTTFQLVTILIILLGDVGIKKFTKKVGQKIILDLDTKCHDKIRILIFSVLSSKQVVKKVHKWQPAY